MQRLLSTYSVYLLTWIFVHFSSLFFFSPLPSSALPHQILSWAVMQGQLRFGSYRLFSKNWLIYGFHSGIFQVNWDRLNVLFWGWTLLMKQNVFHLSPTDGHSPLPFIYCLPNCCNKTSYIGSFVCYRFTEVELEDQRGVCTRLLSRTQSETTHFFH